MQISVRWWKDFVIMSPGDASKIPSKGGNGGQSRKGRKQGWFQGTKLKRKDAVQAKVHDESQTRSMATRWKVGGEGAKKEESTYLLSLGTV